MNTKQHQTDCTGSGPRDATPSVASAGQVEVAPLRQASSVPVDVLAGELRVTNTAHSPGITTAIAAAAATLPAGTYWLISDEARAAVAELIEAAGDYLANPHDAEGRNLCAVRRLRAALARVGGDA